MIALPPEMAWNLPHVLENHMYLSIFPDIEIKEITMSALKESFGRCTVNQKFLDRFYDIFLASHPDIKPMFEKTDFSKQKALLRSGISMMIMYEDGTQVAKMALDRLGHSHGKQGMNIAPKMYQYWIDSLVAAVKECDPQFSPALEKHWRDAMRRGINYMISAGQVETAA